LDHNDVTWDGIKWGSFGKQEKDEIGGSGSFFWS